MADDAAVAAAKLGALQVAMKTAQGQAEAYSSAAAKASGQVALDYAKVAKILKEIAKVTLEQLKAEETLGKEKKKHLELLEEEKKLEKDGVKGNEQKLKFTKQQIKDQEKVIAQANIQLDTTKKQSAEQQKLMGQIAKDGSFVGKIMEGLGSKFTKLLGAERIYAAMRKMGEAARDVADISIQSGSFLGMTGNIGDDMAAIGAQTLRYGRDVSIAQSQLMLLGISQEEVNQSFKSFSKISGGSTERMKDLTLAAGSLGKLLGLSATEATDFFIEAQLKFGRTATQSAQTMQQLQKSVENANKGLRQQVVNGRDVAKVLMDISKESDAAAQDQGFLGQMLTSNLVHLQQQGMNYQQALKGATTYIEALTTKAPNWTRIMAGKDLLKQAREMGPAFVKELEKAQPGLAAKIKGIAGSTMGEFQKEKLIQKMLEGTGVGISAMDKQMRELIRNAGEGASTVIEAVYGIADPLQQKALIDQAAAADKQEASAAKLVSLNDLLQKAKKDGNEEEANRVRKQLEDEFKLKHDSVDQLSEYYAKDQVDRMGLVKGLQEQADKEQIGRDQEQAKARRDAESDALKKKADAARAAGNTGMADIYDKQSAGLSDTGVAAAAGEAIHKQAGAAAVAAAADPITTLFKQLDTPVGALVTGMGALVLSTGRSQVVMAALSGAAAKAAAALSSVGGAGRAGALVSTGLAAYETTRAILEATGWDKKLTMDFNASKEEEAADLKTGEENVRAGIEAARKKRAAMIPTVVPVAPAVPAARGASVSQPGIPGLTNSLAATPVAGSTKLVFTTTMDLGREVGAMDAQAYDLIPA